jgi:alpha-1,6-mannosyltransferase
MTAKLSGPSKLICDLTQSWSEVGGGVRTYLLHKRQHILDHTNHRHLLIIPGARDSVEEQGRLITVTIASPKVPGSPNYRLMLRNGAVRSALERFLPDLIECQDAYNLPWAAIGHRKRHPDTALVAAYMTDFPTVYVSRPLSRILGRSIAGALGRISYGYAARLYSHFDQVFALSEHGGAATLRAHGVASVDVVPLGVELGGFGPDKRDETLRQSLGLEAGQPLLIYVGRLDGEKRAQTVVDAFLRLPSDLGARLALLGEGPLRDEILALGNPRIVAPGYISDRGELGRWLASSDIYVSGMADETFGVSIVEAQASGLPVVGVAAGAMIERISPQTGRLGPVDDDAAMAANILEMWNADRAAIAREARRTALGYSWDHTMELLFGRVYPKAFAARSLVKHATGSQPGNLAGSLRKEAV